jgi:NTP pyrophosphatase (non-canonical NTP hydrolase)
LSLRQLQAEQAAWSARNFGENRPSHWPLLGAIEELGELAHAHLKGEQGIRYNEVQVRAKQWDALGDIIIYLLDYANLNNIDLQDAIYLTWKEVKKRDWVKNPLTAATEATSAENSSL